MIMTFAGGGGRWCMNVAALHIGAFMCCFRREGHLLNHERLFRLYGKRS